MFPAIIIATILGSFSFKYFVDIPINKNTHTITIKDDGFHPDFLVVRIGDTVIWNNSDDITHTVTSTSFDYELDPNESVSVVFNEIFNQLGESSGEKVFAELMKFNYTSSNLQEGLASGSEIIVYGIPYYYTIRQSALNDYDNLLTTF